MHLLNTTTVAHLPMAASGSITDHVTNCRSPQTGFFNMMVTPLGSDLSPVEHLWDVVKLEILIVDTAGKSAAAV